MVTGTVQKMWHCSLCGEPFQHCLKRLQHRRVHSSFRPYICYEGNCTKLFSTLSAYQIHRRYHTDQRIYNCQKCGLKFLSLRHRRLHNCKARTYKCNICSQRFLHLLPLRYHHKTRHEHRMWKFSTRDRKKLKIKFKKKNYNIKNRKQDICDKNGDKILLKITAGTSTTIISPKRKVSDKKCSEKHSKKKSKKRERKTEKEKTRNGIILSIKTGSVNSPQGKQSYICKPVNGLQVDQEPVKHLTDLKLKIKTYPNLTIKQNDEKTVPSSEVFVPNLHNRKVTPERLCKEGEKAVSQIQLNSDVQQNLNVAETKVRNGIVIVKDKSGRFQAEQLQVAKLRKRDRDNVFDSFNDVGVWKVMPSPRTDNPFDALKLRLSPQKPLRLDPGTDSNFESARYLDVALKTKVYNSGDDSDVFDASSVIDKDSENGAQGVNDSGIEVLSSSTIRSNGNSVRSIVLDESSPNYLNTEDSLLSLDSPVAEVLCKSEHSLCHKCGGIVIETNNNTRSPGRCRCFVSNPNSPFQTPLSPMKINSNETSDKMLQENKKKCVFPEQAKFLETEKQIDNKSDGKSSQSNESSPNQEHLDIDSDGSDVLFSGSDNGVPSGMAKGSDDESANGVKSLRLKIQLGENPSALPVKKEDSRKHSPDKRVKKSPTKLDKNEKLETFKGDALIGSSVSNSPSNCFDQNTLHTVGKGDEEDGDDHMTLENLRRTLSKGLMLPSNSSSDKHASSLSPSNSVEEKTGIKQVPSETLLKNDIEDDTELEMNKVEDNISKEKVQAPYALEKGFENHNVHGSHTDKETLPSADTNVNCSLKTVKRKPLFKSAKSSHSNVQNDSASDRTEIAQALSVEGENSAGIKKQINKKRTRAVSTCEDGNKMNNRRPIFKRTLSAAEHKISIVDDSLAVSLEKMPEKSLERNKSLFEKFAGSDAYNAETSNIVKTEKTNSAIKTAENSQKQADLGSKSEYNDPQPQVNGSIVNDTNPVKSSSAFSETEDSLQAVPSVEPEECTPVSPTGVQKEVTPLNPFQQQFLSFISSTKLSDSKFLNKNAKSLKSGENEKPEKEDSCSLENNEIDMNLEVTGKLLKNNEDSPCEEMPKKSDSVSWLNIFSQINPEKCESQKVSASENQDDIGDFNDDLAAINEKMDTQEAEDSDSLDVDEIFESKNLSNLQPLQNPKDSLSPDGKQHPNERGKSMKRRMVHGHSISEYSDNSSEADTIDLFCCHKKHDPDFNPYMDSDEDFMPVKSFRRRQSTGRRVKKSRMIRSLSNDIDFRHAREDKFDERSETNSQTSRSRRSKQGMKSCCPCCLGSFGDFEDDELIRKPSYKLPRNYKQFVKSTLRLMQLQEKIHQLFITLFPNCTELISRVKIGTEEFEILIEDILYGLESQEVEFEPPRMASDPPSGQQQAATQSGLCHRDGSIRATSVSDTGTTQNNDSNEMQVDSQNQEGTSCCGIDRKTNITDHLQRSNSSDLKNQNLPDNSSKKCTNSGDIVFPKGGDHVHCKKVSGLSETVGNCTSSDNIESTSVGTVEQKSSGLAKLNSQDSCKNLPSIDPQLISMDNTNNRSLTNSNEDKPYNVLENLNSTFVDNSVSGVQNHLQITIDLSAARVSVCREPKHCLERLHGQLVKLVKYLLPGLDLKNYFYRNIDNIEFLVDLMIASNDNQVTAEAELMEVDTEAALNAENVEAEHGEVNSEADLSEVNSEIELIINHDKNTCHVDTIPKPHLNTGNDQNENIESKTSSVDEVEEKIPFEQRIKSQRESLKKDVFEFEEDDTVARIKESESVLSNIESKIAKRTSRTKSRETRLRKRTAEEKRTLFVQEKIQNCHNSTIVCHSKSKTPPVSKVDHKSKHFENSKHRFLSELNLGDKHELSYDERGGSEAAMEVKSVSDTVFSDKNVGEVFENENRRKSNDKNIFELMQPSQAAESAL